MNANGIDFKTCYLTEPGVFIKNKGCFVFQELDHFAFWLVIDVVDFLPAKESVELIVDQLCSELAVISSLSRSYIRKCLNKTHSLFKNTGNGLSLKASLVLIVTDYSEMIWAVSGNSRMYLIRDCQFAFRSRDQSVAQSLVESEIISEDSINSVADRDILTNYLGIEYGFAPFVSRRFQLQDGDVIILCNLGFWEQLHSETFKQLLETVDTTELLPIIKERFLDRDPAPVNTYIAGMIAVHKVLSHYRSAKFQLRLPLGEKQIAIILAALLGMGGLVGAWITNKSKMETENKLKTVQTITQKNTVAAYEQKGDQFVNEAKYAEANLEYDQALNILSTYVDKDPDTERKIRLKISIILMLKDGDDFLTKTHYENALNRYETARDFDTSNYFRSQIAIKIDKTRRLMNARREEPRPTPEKTPNMSPESSKGAIIQTERIIPTQPIAVPKRAKNVEPVNNARKKAESSVNAKTPTSATPVKSESGIKVPAKSNTARKEPDKPQVTEKVIGKVVKETNQEISKSKQTEAITNNEPNVKLKTASPADQSGPAGKSAPKISAVPPVDRKKLAKATDYLKRGDELAGKKRFRQAMNCYKKAQDIFIQLNMVVKAAQLNEKIEATRQKMRDSFEGAH